SADRGTVAWRGGQRRGDRLAGQLGGGDLFRRQLAEDRLLLGGGRGVDAGVCGLPEARGQVGVVLAGGTPGGCDDLGSEQAEQNAVLVGAPWAAVAAQEGRAGALLAAETDRTVEQARYEPLEAH